MQILKTLSLTLFLSTVAMGSSHAQPTALTSKTYADTPAKTIIIKHPAANDVATFFSSSTVYSFEVFKPGTSAEMDKIVATLKKDAEVADVAVGKVTGDYHAITVTVKSVKNKMYFSSLFKKAGLNTIKINNNPITEVDKM